MSSGLSADIDIGEDFAVSAESASRRTLNQLDIKVMGSTLYIERDPSWTDWSLFAARRDAMVRVSLPTLKRIEASAGSDVHVSGEYGVGLDASTSSGSDLELEDVTGGSFTFEASSGSTLRAEGDCDDLDASSSSGASIIADDLKCATIEASASSGADIRVFASESADAQASSGADVRVSGDPATLSSEESSGGDVRRD